MVFLIHVALYTTLILVDAHPVEWEVELKLLDLVQPFQQHSAKWADCWIWFLLCSSSILFTQWIFFYIAFAVTFIINMLQGN